MIKVASFPQPFEIEEDDPIYEINPCITSQIKDMPQEIQERIESYTGSRMGQHRSFILKTKDVRK